MRENTESFEPSTRPLCMPRKAVPQQIPSCGASASAWLRAALVLSVRISALCVWGDLSEQVLADPILEVRRQCRWRVRCRGESLLCMHVGVRSPGSAHSMRVSVEAKGRSDRSAARDTLRDHGIFFVNAFVRAGPSASQSCVCTRSQHMAHPPSADRRP
jgi:hypothetical protein